MSSPSKWPSAGFLSERAAKHVMCEFVANYVRTDSATGYAERHPQVSSTRGRKSRWSGYDKSRVRQALDEVLARGTKRIGMRSFLEHYLLILDFPADVAEALEAGKINLFEAEQLARLTAKRLDLPEVKAQQRRAAFLRVHEQAAATGMRLKAKIDAVLSPERQPILTAKQDTPGTATSLITATTSPSETNETLPPEHLFSEYLRLITSLLQAIRVEDLSDAELSRVADYAEPLLRFLHSIHKQQNPSVHEPQKRPPEQKFFI